jgi:hypothetical protein
MGKHDVWDSMRHHLVLFMRFMPPTLLWRLTGDVKLELFNDEFLITDNVLDQVAY